MSNDFFIPTNEFQTPVTKELLDKYPDEIQEWFLDAITNIEFIKNLISPNRRRAKDMPRDAEGKIIIDLENPHICENMDYFRQAALHFQKFGCYTFLKPNSNPQSEYRKFWAEEIRRCREGYIRESDGEWVTGFCYFFLNYTPMMLNIVREDAEGGNPVADRVEGFPNFFEGIYWRFHYLYKAKQSGKHAIELAKRGCGKSYSLASIMVHNLLLGESTISHKRITTSLVAYEKEYLKEDKDGTLNKFTPTLDYVRKNTEFPKLLLKNSPNEMSWIMGYKDRNTGITKGSRNTVLGVSAKDNPDKCRGKRGWVLIEEMGTFKGLLGLYDTTKRSVEDGKYAFACIYLVGTANQKESSFESAKTLLYKTKAYRIYTLNNVWDKPKQGKPTFGFFFPAYVNRLGCYNKDGVSDVVKALLEIFEARYIAKYGADPQSVLSVIAEDPITPAEAIIKVKTAYFPITQLNERASQLDNDPKAYNDIYVGDLVQNQEGKIVFRPTEDVPIRKWGVPNDTPGAIEIYEMPEKNANDEVYSGRYIIGHDPVDNDSAESSSLSSTFVFDLFTDKIVAEFTGRRAFADDNYEIVRKLALFYNAKVLFESNKKGIFAYFQTHSSTHLLAETPEYLREKQLIKYSNFGSNRYGVNASAAINAYADSLLRDWLLKPETIIVKDEDGHEHEERIPMLYFLRNRALIDECIGYSPEVNVDRVRAMGMVMLLRQEKIALYQGDMSRAKNDDIGDPLADDPFFTRNFDMRFPNVNLAD